MRWSSWGRRLARISLLGLAVTDEGELIAGRYRLTSRLGSGAMGVIWRAQDERLHRTVAIKQLLASARLSETDADEANRRAMREGRIAARLHHPHAITVYDVVEHDGQPCLVMEYLPSRSLATVLFAHGALQPDTVARIGRQIASALAAAHRAGIVHRDIKPGNVLLADDGTAKITDFGISHAVGEVTVTATGLLVGTPAYLAPEVAQGEGAGFPSDVFSLGSTLYTALEGMPPFGHITNSIALLHQVASGEITPPEQSGPLTPVLLRLLERNPEQRPTMQQAHDALAALAAGLVEPEGRQSGPEPPPPRSDPPVEVVPRARQALLRSAPPEDTTSPVVPTGGDATTGGSRPEGARPEGGGWSQRRKRLAGVIVAVLLAAGVLWTVLLSQGKVTGGNAAAPTGTPGRPAHSIPSATTRPGTGSTTQRTTATTPTAPTAPSGPQDTPAQLESAITDYYALMPDNLSAGWTHLTANYQQNHAKGFSGYQNFWNAVARVTVRDVSAEGAGAVTATIDYFFKDGRVVEELTSYGLVAEDGLWKIDTSTVRSSQTRQ